MPRTFRSRLMLACSVIFVAMLLLLQWNAQRQMTQALQRSLQDQAALAAPLVNAAMAPLLASRDYASLQELVEASVRDRGVAAMEVLDHRGQRVAASGRDDAGDGPALELPLVLAEQHYGVARVRLNTGLLTRSRDALLLNGFLIGALVLAGGGLALALLLALMSQGSARVVQAARRIAAGDLSVQLPATGATEVRDVAEAFNRMSQAVQAQVRALSASEQRLRSVVAAMSEGLVVNEADGRLSEANEAAARILGRSVQQLIGASAFTPMVTMHDANGRPLALAERPAVLALTSGTPQRDVLVQIPDPSGETRWVQINCEPILLGGSRQPSAVVSTLTDVTSHVLSEERLRQANQSLEERVHERTAQLRVALDGAEQASRAKSEFLSRMSHELRTPLNAILGFAQLLSLHDSGMGAAQRGQLRQIETAGWHLLDLIDEVLDLSRIEAGALTVSLEPVALGPLYAQAQQMNSALAQPRAITLHPLDEAGAALWVQADRKRLLQVLNNLLSNAIKYNRQAGEVRVLARAQGEEVWLTVVDTGPGLTAEQLSRLFVPFQRLASDADATPGTGIGLVITRRLVELMGGRVIVESQPGEGSRFGLVLPAARPLSAMDRAGDAGATAPAAPAAPESCAVDARPGASIVYVEDNPSNVQLVLDVLSRRPGLEVEACADGLSGLERIRARPPALAIVDIDLPRMDGRELCRRLRADPATARVPLLALTAQAMPQDLRQTRAAGFDLVLTKPLDVNELLGAVDLLLQQGAQ